MIGVSDETRDMQIKLNSLTRTDNPSQIIGKFVVHDFKPSWYGDIITEQVCMENMRYLVGQYICCGYVPREANDGEDALLDHMVVKEINRDTGREMQNTATVPIGHITDTYISENEDGDRVLYCDAILWVDKFYNVISLLDEWLSNGIPVPCSCEYRFSNYNVADGVAYIQSPIYYKALTILNAEKRGDIDKVYPAYDCSCLVGYEEKFNQALTKDIEINSTHGVDNKEYGKGEGMENETVVVDTVETVEEVVEITEPVEAVETVENPIPSDIDTVDVVENAQEEVATDEKTTDETVDKSEYDKVVESLNSANDKIKSLEAELLESKNAQVDLNVTLESLNAQVETLKVCEKELNEIKYNERLAEAKEKYKAEFEVFNGIEVFESEEIQNLIVESLSDENSFNAIVKIKDAILECAKESKPVEQVSLNSADSSVIEKNKKLNSSVPVEKTYGFRVQ